MEKKKLAVKKGNELITASYTLTLAEQRMVLLAIASGQKQLPSLHIVTAEQYAETYKVTRQTAYEALQTAAAQLFERRYSVRQSLDGGKIRHALRRWVSEVAYIEGGAHVELRFTPDVLQYLDDLKNKFTSYSIEQVASLTSTHAIRLYELLIQWRSVGKTPTFELAMFREMLGIQPEEYKEMANFKRRVLDVAVRQINEHTDIKAEYAQHKRGRSITGFSFSFTVKQIGQTDADAEAGRRSSRQTISKSKAESMARRGESYPELYKRLSREYIIK